MMSCKERPSIFVALKQPFCLKVLNIKVLKGTKMDGDQKKPSLTL